ncbi:recF protein [Agrilactobacillus composti DSM 18527 = JCM 14202]|uniref:DNA replication and repair protein RecF n=1 Tax=Agrilactobacillus composti DSM 18527 = JCM 14202 TaxID=1423734 RepID=X0PQD1_9LACO|nr:DNA replication/repair protein RecF [Agrilactobacillus composti]KRM35004.1 recF protein [Agrilactobacillus composti DSM 18527 = JCM 14202]GAF39296.1 DNA recombination and repair protein RecF [Agrilactobacillus composti DSM 18527 = JCM 14202]
MYLAHLELTHFRNYDALALDFDKGINIFIGANAQGKTNLLEAIYALALTRSHRTSNDKALIGWHQDFARLSGDVIRRTGKLPLELIISKQGKRAKVNHLEQSKLSAYLGHFNVVLFAPEDLEIVKGAPTNRRHFIDMEFGQMNANYLSNLSQFKLVLKQRNAYLRKLKYKEANDLVYLEVLSDQLAAFGAKVIHLRYDLLAQMAKFAAVIHGEITNQREVLTFKYQTLVAPKILAGSEEQLYQAIKGIYQDNQKREVEQGTTLFGPHRDDVAFFVNDQNVQSFGSQGQQRTTALSVKLAEIDLIQAQTGEYPVLLLDDVLSELDDVRQTHLLKAFQDKVQTFLTTTSIDNVKQDIIKAPKIFNIENGQIKA